MLTGWKSQILWNPFCHKSWEVFWQHQCLPTSEELWCKSQLNNIFCIQWWFTNCCLYPWLFANERKKLLNYKTGMSKLNLWSYWGLDRRLQGGLNTRRLQQQLVARTAKFEVGRDCAVIVVSTDMALCVTLCVLCIDIESFHRLMDILYWSKAVQSYHRYLLYKTAKVTLKIVFSW